MKKVFLPLMVAISFGVFAQETNDPMEMLEQRTVTMEETVRGLKKLKISGYIQAQYQYGQSEEDGTYFKLQRANAYESSAVIPGTEDLDESGKIIPGTGVYKGRDDFGRFGVRRGRVKFTYTEGIAEGVLQLDMTDAGVGFKDAYIGIKDPWIGTCGLKAGIFDRPFGHEISYSSSRRESPERSRIFQRLFPGERDLGVSLTLQGPKNTPLNMVKFEGGLFAGNGSSTTAAFRQFNNHVDFIGRLSVTKVFGSEMQLSGGVSAYLGGVQQSDSLVYVMEDNRFVLESNDINNIGKFAKRQYFGVDLQYSVVTLAGLTQLRTEYIMGEHAQNAAGGFGFNATSYPAFSGPTYMRKINGGYVILTQDLGKLPLTAVVKYDWYNPNTEVSGDDIASPLTDTEKAAKKEVAKGTGNHGDIMKSNIGLGLIWRVNQSLRLTAYYDIASNETTENLPDVKNKDGQIISYGYEGNRPANVFTLRLQYKF